MAAFYADIVVTNRCNFRCKHCDCGQRNQEASGLAQNWKADKELTPLEWITVLRKVGAARVWIRGVEPLLYSGFDRLAKLIVKEKIRLAGFTTNGWLLDRHWDSVMKYSEMVVVSIDGWEKTHDEIRGVKGAFKRAYGGVSRLKKAGKQVLVSYAITPVNTQDMISFYDGMTALGIPIIFNHYNFIHPKVARKFSCSPTNISVYNPKDIDVGRVIAAVRHCAKAQWSPLLTTRREVRRYYQEIPEKNVDSKGKLCNALQQQTAGTRAVIVADGTYILSHRCWFKGDMGNALTSDVLPAANPVLRRVAKKITQSGFPPPCQRLCCAGKMI